MIKSENKPYVPLLFTDTETFSTVDIKTAGTVKYADSAELMLAGFIKEGKKGLYDFSDPDHQEIPWWVLEHVEKGDPVVAHNALFDFVVLKKHIPNLRIEQMVDSQAIVAAHGLPLGLAKAGEALGLDTQKYKGGAKLVRRFCIPRKPSLYNKSTRTMPADDPEGWAEFRETYLWDDIYSMIEIVNRLGLLSPKEQQVWLDTQRINLGGVPIDLDTVHLIVDKLFTLVDDESSHFIRLTGVFPTQRARVLVWLESQGYPLPNLQAATVVKAINDPKAPQLVKDALIARANTTHMSFKKFQTMLNAAMDDGRIRGTLMYHVAGTGRFGGRLLQTQNLTKGSIDGEEAVARIQQDEFTVELVKSAVRPMIYHPDGFTIVDYASIEARIVQYVAEDEDALDIFRQGKDPYVVMGAKIYGVPESEVTAKQRFTGKQAILGLGYQMSAKKFISMVESYGETITTKEAQLAVNVYRESHPKLVTFWDHINKCAIQAMRMPYNTVRLNKHVAFRYEDDFLYMHLPSRRRMAYYKPELGQDSYGISLTYMSMNEKNQYVRTHTYGGKLTENLVQAFARDILVDAVHRLMMEGLTIVTHIHDEIVVLGRQYEVDEIAYLMCKTPVWAYGLPLEAEGETVQRFKKI